MSGDHQIEIEPIRATGGARYRVHFNGEVLIERSRDPEHEAPRALLALGITGRLTTYWRGSAVPAMRLDIETAAKLTTEESAKVGPRIVRWREFPANARQTSPQTCACDPLTGKLDAAATTLAVD